MSVVACKININGYDIASDSITVRGYTQTTGGVADGPKLFEVNDVIVGSTGKAEEVMLLRLFLDTHTFRDSNEQSVLELLSEFSDWKYKKINNSAVENNYLLGIGNNVFCVEGWDIQKVTSYMAIGAGQTYALAALYLGQTAEKAVETAIELSIYCAYPIRKLSR